LIPFPLEEREIGTRSQGQDNQDLLIPKRAEARNRRPIRRQRQRKEEFQSDSKTKQAILSLKILRIGIAFAFFIREIAVLSIGISIGPGNEKTQGKRRI